MIQAVTESNAKKQKYHAVECINCRKQIKVPLSQMKRYVPLPVDETKSEPTEE
jgi:hypothetical protein